VVVAAAMLAGCGSKSDKPASSGPTTITVAVQAGVPEVAIYKKLSADWEKQTGNHIQWVEIPQASQHDKLVTDFAANAKTYDAIGINQQWIAEFAAAGYVDSLDSRLSAGDKADFVPNELTMLSYKDKLYGIPQYLFAPVLFYRPDLFDKHGLRKPTLEQPLTADEFLADAQKLTADGNFGTIVEAKRSVVSAVHFQEYVYREGGQIVDADRKAHVNEPPAVKALQYMVDLVKTHKVAPPGALGFDNVDNHTLFSQGKLGMAINFPYAYSLISDPAKSTVSGKFAIALPFKAAKTTSVVGGWGLGIPKQSKHKDVAWDWIKFLTSTDQLYNLRKQSFAPPARKSELSKLQADPAVTPAQREALQVMMQAVDNGLPVPGVPEYSKISDRLAIALQEAIGGTPPQQALDAAQKDIQAILSK
jgi:multiple sugar transport system substrate-binding protein